MRTAVVGHVEWVQFLHVDHVPEPGEIVHADESWEIPAGGGAAAAVQLAKLSDEALFFTARGNDELGHRFMNELTKMGLRVHAAERPEPTRRAVTHIDRNGERTITVVGSRLAPVAKDHLPWSELDGVDALYFTAGDVGALREARRARIVVATARVLSVLKDARVELDAVVGSAVDASEGFAEDDLDPPPRLLVWTHGAEGGTFAERGQKKREYRAVEIPGPIVDRYGAGDSFAGALAWALGAGHEPKEAVELAARCGAAVLTGRGPYEAQLTRAELTSFPVMGEPA